MKHPKLYFEDYLRLFTNRDAALVEHLNKILSIHGILQQKIKAECLSVLDSVEMIDPNRSTLRFRDSVYPCAQLLLVNVLADVKALEWVECPLGYILAVGSAIGKENPNNFSRPIGVVSTVGSAEQGNLTRSIPNTTADFCFVAATAASQEKRKRLKKRKANPSRPISIHPPKTKSKEKFSCPVSSIGTAGSESGDTEAENLSIQMFTITAGQKKSMRQQERRNRELLAEVECCLNAT